MAYNEDDESAQLIQELRETITDLRSEKSDLQYDLDEVRSELRDEKDENDELLERIEELEQNEPLSKQFNEIFEFYDTIWSDTMKDEMLITKLRELHREFR